MTREEAIKIFQLMKKILSIPNSDAARTIEALSAEAVSREEYEEVKEEYINTVGAILAVISAPSCLKEVNDLIEPLKVVRCKDCIHYEKHETWSACTYWSGNPYEQASVIDDDFCSYGERREP